MGRIARSWSGRVGARLESNLEAQCKTFPDGWLIRVEALTELGTCERSRILIRKVEMAPHRDGGSLRLGSYPFFATKSSTRLIYIRFG